MSLHSMAVPDWVKTRTEHRFIHNVHTSAYLRVCAHDREQLHQLPRSGPLSGVIVPAPRYHILHPPTGCNWRASGKHPKQS